ncbi:hypothetical protein RUND412_005678 [Rhizina undulata]
MLNLLVVGFLASSAAASYNSNINYGSPSASHPNMGIALSKVTKRHVDYSGQQDSSSLSFTHGVASGDPYPESVILWTRAAPSVKNVNGTISPERPLYELPVVENGPVCVEWEVAGDAGFKNVANKGQAYTSSDIDYTVKVEATGLEPFTNYFYRFSICGSNNTSPVGRTKTIPLPDDEVKNGVTLAVYSCSNYPFGYFNAYGGPVRRNTTDYVIHLGDYIYEYKNGDYGWGDDIDRVPQPDVTITTLYDYRTRIAQYREDQDLLDSHQHFPWISVWDDHEVADNSYRDGTADMNNTEDSFIKYDGVSFDQRKANAVRAYFEWMPLRQVDMDDNLRIWRNFSLGGLLDLVMLDTRHYERSLTDLYWNTEYVKEISNDQGRSIMGPRQEHWFYNQLSESSNRGAAWRIVGSQIVFSRLNESFSYGSVTPEDYDAWDGYVSNKNRTLAHLYENNINNTIFISGDSHANWVSDLVWLDEHPYNSTTGAGSIGIELAGTAISSPCPFGQNITIEAGQAVSQKAIDANVELQWSEVYYRGYFELNITPQKATAKFYGYPDLTNRNSKELLLATFEVLQGENKLRRNPTVAGGTVANGIVRGGN